MRMNDTLSAETKRKERSERVIIILFPSAFFAVERRDQSPRRPITSHTLRKEPRLLGVSAPFSGSWQNSYMPAGLTDNKSAVRKFHKVNPPQISFDKYFYHESGTDQKKVFTWGRLA